MSGWDLRVVKFGGSIITWKEKPLTARRDAIKRLATELREALSTKHDMRLVVVHGGGSFGHYSVRKCLETVGYIDSTCFSRISYFMTLLNSIIVKEMLDSGLAPVSVAPHVLFRITSENEVVYNLDTIKEYLARGLVPVLYGDVVIEDRGYRVLSGDSIVWLLAKTLGVKEVVFVTDVGGLYNKDPKRYKDALMIRWIKACELSNLEFAHSLYDVTGSMGFKLIEGLRLGVRGVTAKIVSGMVEGNLYKALTSGDFLGTVVEY